MWQRLPCLIFALLLAACGAASRALVHKEDMAKVFPWPRGKSRMIVRVMPKTTLANSCHFFGSYEEVAVTRATTFYVVDELDTKFAYTPNRSPIRRLARVQSMEIRWPASVVAREKPPEQAESVPAPQKASPKPKPLKKKKAVDTIDDEVVEEIEDIED
jgi:hypothetical protein